MSKEPDPTWVVEVSFDPMWKAYSIGGIVKMDNPYDPKTLPPRYLILTSPDELGAYRQARTCLWQLGFRTANP